MNTRERILYHPTLEDAREWEATSEKFTYCIDWLRISAHSTLADEYVNLLEDKFENIIETHEFVRKHLEECKTA